MSGGVGDWKCYVGVRGIRDATRMFCYVGALSVTGSRNLSASQSRSRLLDSVKGSAPGTRACSLRTLPPIVVPALPPLGSPAAAVLRLENQVTSLRGFSPVSRRVTGRFSSFSPKSQFQVCLGQSPTTSPWSSCGWGHNL